MSPDANFEVERSETHLGLVHIRSCFSNKYWVREHSDSHYIIAGSVGLQLGHARV